jgi:hypothetical protein
MGALEKPCLPALDLPHRDSDLLVTPLHRN